MGEKLNNGFCQAEKLKWLAKYFHEFDFVFQQHKFKSDLLEYGNCLENSLKFSQNFFTITSWIITNIEKIIVARLFA